MRNALATLPWVEQDSIKTDVNTQEASFRLKDKSQFDFEQLKKALANQDFPNVTLKHGPG